MSPFRDPEMPTYKDYKIGQLVTCVKVDDFFDQHLTVGKQYKINDVDFHFPNAICVKTDGGISMFINIELFFEKKIEIRDRKIDILLS